MQLNEREVNGTPIHKNVRQIAAGNSAEHGANTARMVAPLANRMFHMQMELCHKAWLQFATLVDVKPVIRAWIATSPDMLHTFSEDSAEDAFASPRSIVELSEFTDDLDLSDRTEQVAMQAPIMFLGTEAGTSLLDFAQASDLPPIADILHDPASCDIPGMKGGTMHMLGQSLVSIADASNVAQVVTALGYLPADFRALTFNSFFGLPKAKQAELMMVKEYIQFSSANMPMLSKIKSNKKI